MNFGLGLVLSLTDNATAGLNNAINSLNSLTRVAENASQSLNSLVSLSAFSVVSNQIGTSFTKVGSGILSMFSNLLTSVKNIGGEFENFDVTLTSLFGGAEEGAKKSQDALNKLFDFAKKSPLEVGDVKDMIVTLQSQGVNAFDEATGAISGARQEYLAFLTDLKSFKPEVSNERFKLAIQNYIGSGEKKMIRTVFDMGDIEDIIGHGVSDTVEGRMNDLIEMVEIKGLTGLSEEMSNTWQGVASNISDAFTQVYYAIASNGVFDKLKTSFVSLADSIIKLEPEELSAMGKTIADALNVIVTPIQKVAELMSSLIGKVIKLAQTNPTLVKVGVIVSVIAGSLLVFSGVALKFMSALGMLTIGLTTFSRSFRMIGGILKTGSLKILGTLLPLTATLGLMYLAWKSDFAGIKTNVTHFVSNIQNSFKTAREAVNGSLSDMTSKLSELKRKDDFFSNITIGAMKLIMTLKALNDAWGDNELSEDNYLKAKELGILPLIEAILDLKYRFGLFKEGFIAGWKEVSETFASIGKGISSSLKGTALSGFIDMISKFFQKLTDNDAEAWYTFGQSFAKFTSAALMFIVAIKGMSILIGIGSKIATVFRAATMIFNGTLTAVSAIGKALSFFGSIVRGVIGFFKMLGAGWTLVIGGIILAVTNFVSMWKNGFNKVKAVLTILGSTLAGVGLVIAGIAAWPAIVVAALVGAIAVAAVYIKDHIEQIKEFFNSVGEWCVTVFNNAFEGIKNFFSNLGVFFSTTWENIKKIFSTIGVAIADAITGTVKGAINGILGGAARIINGFISAINLAIGVLNKVPGIDIKKLSPLEVPKLALGGIVDKPTLSVIGEAGKEAVMPLENNTGWMSSLASVIAEKVNGLKPIDISSLTPSNNGGSNYNSTNNTTNTNNNTNNTTQNYTTRNNTVHTYEGDTDNSVVFKEGAIKVVVQQATEAEAKRLAVMIMSLIKRQKQLDAMLQYN